MMHTMKGLALVTALTVASVPAIAGEHDDKRLSMSGSVCAMIPGVCAMMQDSRPLNTQAAQAQAVPEIDAASAGLAFALLGGIVAIRRERNRRR